MKRFIPLLFALSLHAQTFAPGDRVVVTASPDLRVRNLPNTLSLVIGRQTNGALGTILNGPQNGEGYIWWEINYDAAPDGWSIEKSGTNIWLSKVVAPNTPPPLPTNAPIATAIIPMILIPSDTLPTGVTNYRVYGAQWPLRPTNFWKAPIKADIGTNLNWVYESATVGPWEFVFTAWKNGVESPMGEVWKTEVPAPPKRAYGFVWEYAIKAPTNFLPLSFWKLKPVNPQP